MESGRGEGPVRCQGAVPIRARATRVQRPVRPAVANYFHNDDSDRPALRDEQLFANKLRLTHVLIDVFKIANRGWCIGVQRCFAVLVCTPVEDPLILAVRDTQSPPRVLVLNPKFPGIQSHFSQTLLSDVRAPLCLHCDLKFVAGQVPIDGGCLLENLQRRLGPGAIGEQYNYASEKGEFNKENQ